MCKPVSFIPQYVNIPTFSRQDSIVTITCKYLKNGTEECQFEERDVLVIKRCEHVQVGSLNESEILLFIYFSLLLLLFLFFILDCSM